MAAARAAAMTGPDGAHPAVERFLEAADELAAERGWT
jgi:hypothetical protein